MLAARTWIFWLTGVLIIGIWTCFGHFNHNQSKGISCLCNYFLIRLFVHPTFFASLLLTFFSYLVDRDRNEKIKEQRLCNEAFRIIKGLHSKSNTFFPLSCLFKLPNYPNYESQTKQNGPKHKFVFISTMAE